MRLHRIERNFVLWSAHILIQYPREMSPASQTKPINPEILNINKYLFHSFNHLIWDNLLPTSLKTGFGCTHCTHAISILDHDKVKTSSDVTNSSTVKLRFQVSTKKLSPFCRRMGKQPPRVKLCTNITLHNEGQTSAWGNNKQKHSVTEEL